MERCENDVCGLDKYKQVVQLHDKDKNSKEYPIFPVTYTHAVYDGKTGANLESMLAQFNNVFLQYQGTAKDTRLLLPKEMRRKGVQITYRNMDDEVVTEKCVNDSQSDNDHWGLDANWMRIDELSLQGDISVSKSGTWIINGADTGVKALGPKGDNGLTPWMKTIDNKLYYSYDNQIWELASDYIAAWFRFTGTSGSSQANNVGKIQISRDEGKTWEDLSGTFTNNLHIKGYVATTSDLPSSAVQGDIYGVGPTYAESDTEHTNPIYKLFVKNENVWVDNGQFTSVAAGVVQELGESETEVVSQKTVTGEFTKDRYIIYPATGIMGNPILDYKHLANYDSDGNFQKYIEDEGYDCAWVNIYEGSTTLTIEGSIPSIIGYFSTLLPTSESLLGKGNTIPTGAKICLINFLKSDNTDGYSNLKITQEGMPASQKRLTVTEDIAKSVNDSSNYITSSFNATPVNINLLDTVDVLKGWGYADNVWVNNPNLISSGKLYLKNMYYTIQNVQAYPTNLNIYIASFDATGNHIGRTVVTYASEDDLTLSFKYTKLKGAAYERIVLSNSGKLDASNMQLEEGPSASAPVAFQGLVFDKDDHEFILQSRMKYSEYPTGKNYINEDDLLYGYSLQDGEWVTIFRGIASNRLFLKDGITYTVSNLAVFNPTIPNMYLAYFDKDGNFLKRTAHAMVVDSTGLKGSCTFTANINDGRTFYVRMVLQSGNINVKYVPNPQLEVGSEATDYEAYAGTKYVLESTGGKSTDNKNVLLTGASFAYPENEWFSYVCGTLGITGYNKAVSGETMQHTAQKMHDGTLYTQEEFEDFDIFLIFHSHNQTVTDTTNLKENYEDYVFPLTDRSAQWDYVLKKYSAECYAARLNENSKWYGTKYGKPCRIVVCTHWHDARTIFNNDIRALQGKWGFILCELDKKIGFSKNQVHPVTGEQVSILHCDNPSNNTEVIDGVTYGWHPTRDKGAWIQHRMASIVGSVMRNL